MHSLAIDLSRQGHEVTGSDDVIFDPSRSRLERAGLLPHRFGWDATRVTSDIDTIVLGMHAQLDNPELLKAQELDLQIMSFPELIYQMSKEAQRVVIAGSHGKTTITAMLTKILHDSGRAFDYALGAIVPGIESPVSIKGEGTILIEGDEYLSSRLDPRSKFLHYHPDILVVTGIAWDHVNVFKTFDEYCACFRRLILSLGPESLLIYCAEDDTLGELINGCKPVCKLQAYHTLQVEQETDLLRLDGEEIRLQIFGKHNYQNLGAALAVSKALDVTREEFLRAMSGFQGASKRLQLISESPKVYRDYAHAPSKLKATVRAVLDRYGAERVVAVYELHTYSSMDAEFLRQYQDSFLDLIQCAVYYDLESVKIKRRVPLVDSQIQDGFGRASLQILRSSDELQSYLDGQDQSSVFLMMSSGNFGGFDLQAWLSPTAG